MTILYKNQGFSLATTNVTTVFTCPTSGVAIVKSVSIANDHSADVQVKSSLTDTSASATYNYFIKTMTSDSSDNAVSGILNLEGGDKINFECTVSNVITGVVNYALIDRSQENG
jgi:hypothetical protein